MMTRAMKAWLTDHGLTAVQVADRAGVNIRKMYRQLGGRAPVQQELTDTLCKIYGMTPAEMQEAIP